MTCKTSLQKRERNLKRNSQCLTKPKDLWKALGLPSKSGGCIFGALAENQILEYDTKSTLKTFENVYSNLAGTLLTKLSKPPNRYTINFVSDLYRKFSISENFDVTKAAGIDQVSEKFLKDGARISAKPISDLYNLSMTLRGFRDACTID